MHFAFAIAASLNLKSHFGLFAEDNILAFCLNEIQFFAVYVCLWLLCMMSGGACYVYAEFRCNYMTGNISDNDGVIVSVYTVLYK